MALAPPPGNERKVKGFYRDVQVPRSSIYVSAQNQSQNVHQKPASTLTQKRKYVLKSHSGALHFYLIMRADDNYTEEDVSNCQGQHDCHNCGRPIFGPICFYPEKIDAKTREPTCNPTPHCRPGCAYRTLQDLENNSDLLTHFFLIYGPDVTCAPPRFLLTIPGVLTPEPKRFPEESLTAWKTRRQKLRWERYHQIMDDQLVVQKECSYIRSLKAPVYLSCTLFHNHQLVPDTVAYIYETTIDRKNAMGPSRTRDNSDLKVVELPPKSLKKTKLSDMFAVEASSFGRTSALSQNPHMQE